MTHGTMNVKISMPVSLYLASRSIRCLLSIVANSSYKNAILLALPCTGSEDLQ
jgi:hypothetical protein